MRVEPFKQGEPKTFSTLLCDGYRLMGVTSLQELRSFIRDAATRHPDCRLLTTLDDLGQASYTSGHSIMANELDNVGGHDLSALDPSCFERGEHLGHLTTKAEFPIRLANLRRASDRSIFKDLKGKLHWGHDGRGLDFFELNADPSLVLDHSEILVQVVPVKSAFEALAAFPNGYFSDDLSPMDLWCLARHLEETYAIELFGIGASYAAFAYPKALSELDQRRVASDVLSLYRDCDAGKLLGRMAQALGASDEFLLCYTQ
jgi:hypothetical protein